MTCLLGMGGLSGPRAILVLPLNHKHLRENKLVERPAGKTDLRVRAIMSPALI